MDMDKYEMPLIELQSTSVWKQKFIDLRVELEKIERRRIEKVIVERSAENEILRV